MACPGQGEGGFDQCGAVQFAEVDHQALGIARFEGEGDVGPTFEAASKVERREQGGVGQQPLHLHGVGRRIVGIGGGRHSGVVAAHAHEREEEEKCEHNIQGEGKEKGQSGSTSK